MKISRKTIAPPRIEMMPLIDIVFLLLVFFIYAMLSMAVHHGQNVDLPISKTALLDTREAINITIQSSRQDIHIFVEQELVSLASLREKLSTMNHVRKNSKNREVQIFADKTVSYKELFQVLDCIKQAGLKHISLQAVPGNVTQ